MPSASVSTATARETGILAQHPHTVANVLNDFFKRGHAPFFTARLLDAFDPAELAQRGITSCLRLHPRLYVLLRLHLDMRTQLVVRLRIQFLLPGQSTKPPSAFPQPVHARFRWSSE